MLAYLELQHRLYLQGKASITFEEMQTIADKFLTQSEKDLLFSE